MLGFCILAPIGDSLAKILGADMPILHLLTVRFAFQALILIPLLWATGKRITTSTYITYMTALRTILHIIGIGAMFTALRYLPIADAIAIAFVMPFIMLLLGKFVLNEEIGPHRLMACVVGFVGTLLVVQPNFAAVGAPALLPLLVAVVFALFMLVTRTIAKIVDPVALQAQSGLMATLVLIPATLIAPFLGLNDIMVMPDGGQIFLLVLMGTLGTVAHLLMTWSLRFAPSATLAPMQYLEIPFATIIGWMIFSDLPNGLAAVGIMITVGAGLYVIWRERVTASNAASSA
jgi:drug/metabolite transporter (DMT)-like permease